MLWVWLIIIILLIWLLRHHPQQQDFKFFDEYSGYISRYLDINKKDKGQDN